MYEPNGILCMNRDRGPSKESSDKWIKESIFRFGVPKEWTADRGLQFESKEFKEFVNGRTSVVQAR